MMNYFVVFLLVLPLTFAQVLHPIRDIHLNVKPAFCSIIQDTTVTNEVVYDIGFSSFTGNILKKDTVFSIKNVNDFDDISNGDYTPNLLSDSLEWPNEVTQVPDGIFDGRFWAVAAGFFLEGKDNGSLAIIDMNDGASTEPILISNEEPDEKWFYHRVEWRDMNNDGHVDAVSARAYGAGDAAEEAQLVWFKNPGLSYPTPKWELNVLHNGSEDIAFRIHDMKMPNGVMTPVVISAGFWCKSLGLTWSETNNWEDLSSIQYLSVGEFGWYFDLEVVDLNMDGRLDILATTWSQLGDPGALLAYEIPDDWQNEKWQMHILQENYEAFRLPGLGSPGSAFSFWPTASMQLNKNKPHIVVSGDDDGKVYLLNPNSESVKDWSYTQSTIYSQPRGTVGSISVGDINSDGFTEIVFAAYEEMLIHIMSYN